LFEKFLSCNCRSCSYRRFNLFMDTNQRYFSRKGCMASIVCVGISW